MGTFRLEVAYRESGDRLAVVGPSGSGKSLTLRTLAGLLGSQAGSVTYGGTDVSDVPVEHRRIGYVPQGLGLMPGRTVWQQVTFGVEADHARAAWWLETLHLDGLADRYPEQLSGGQRQRVSLARALAPGPALVLLDEPFSALDAPVRDELRRELRSLQRKARLSTVLVTHDPEEAAILADEIVVLSDGHVLQAGPVAEVYRRPASLQVAQLLGIRNVGHGVIAADGTVLCGSVSLAVAARLPAGTDVFWSVPREQVRVTRFQADLAGSQLVRPPLPEQIGAHRAVVDDVIDLGSSVEITVRLEGGPALTSRSTDPMVARPGEDCLVHLEPESVTVWPAAAPQSDAPITT